MIANILENFSGLLGKQYLFKQDGEVKTESVKDTLIDLANYAVMTIIEMNKGKNK